MQQGIVLVDHGSRKPESNDQLVQIANLVTGLQPGRAPLLVEIAHMELAEPTIEQAVGRLVARGVRRIFVMPYLLAPGRHATEDIPRLAQVAGATHGVQVEVTACLGVDELLAQLVLERCRQAGFCLPG